MRISNYIVVKANKRYGRVHSVSSRLTKNRPSLEANEIAVKVNLELPDELFDKPQLEATVKVPKEAVSAPVIDAEVVDNVEQIILDQTGFHVKLEVIEADE